MFSAQKLLRSVPPALLAAVVLAPILPAPVAEAEPDNAYIRSQQTRSRQPALERRGSYIQRTYRPQITRDRRAATRRGPACPTTQRPAPVVGVQGGGHAGPHYGGYNVPYVVYIDPTPHEPQVVEEPQRTYQPPPVYIMQPRQDPEPRPEPSAQPPSAPVWRPSAPAPQVAQAPEPERRPRSTEPQPVSLSVRPAGALVYLDDELLGDAGSLSQLDLRPGVYVLEVEHPELTGQRLVFGVDEGPLSVAVDLQADRPSRRSRVK